MKIETFGNNINPKVIVIGVFHGDEPQGDYLIRKYFSINLATNLLLIPCLNKSGMLNNKRVNSNGVDLNRNFPTKNWVSGDINGDYYGGQNPASELETRFLISIIEKFNPKAILTIHSPYRLVNYDGDAKELADKIASIMEYPVEENIGYPTPGSFGTWAGIENHIPTITLELDENVSLQDMETPVFKVFKMLENY